MGAIAPPGRDAAACNKPTSRIRSKKSLQKTAITGSTPSPSYPLPWLPRGHKSSAGTTVSKAEMLSLLGSPTDQDTSITGKAFIPSYFGGDATATRMHYKGLGRVYVSGHGTFGVVKRCSKLRMTAGA